MRRALSEGRALKREHFSGRRALWGEQLFEVVVKILPLTEGEQEKQYVSLNLVVTLTEGMPLKTNGKSFTGCTLGKWSTFK